MVSFVKILTVFGLCALALVSAQANLQDRPCAAPVDETEIPKEWKLMRAECKKAIVDHLKEEFRASLSYLALSGYFQGEKHFRPALSKFFLDSAAEERGHAKKLMDYVLMRGLNIGDSAWSSVKVDVENGLFAAAKDGKIEKNVLGALRKALELETNVTNAIREIIVSCESGNDYNDYHSVDYLTGEFLTEQHESTRQLAGMMASLQQITKNMGNNHGLAELVFDQSLG